MTDVLNEQGLSPSQAIRREVRENAYAAIAALGGTPGLTPEQQVERAEAAFEALNKATGLAQESVAIANSRVLNPEGYAQSQAAKNAEREAIAEAANAAEDAAIANAAQMLDE